MFKPNLERLEDRFAAGSIDDLFATLNSTVHRLPVPNPSQEVFISDAEILWGAGFLQYLVTGVGIRRNALTTDETNTAGSVFTYETAGGPKSYLNPKSQNLTPTGTANWYTTTAKKGYDNKIYTETANGGTDNVYINVPLYSEVRLLDANPNRSSCVDIEGSETAVYSNVVMANGFPNNPNNRYELQLRVWNPNPPADWNTLLGPWLRQPWTTYYIGMYTTTSDNNWYIHPTGGYPVMSFQWYATPVVAGGPIATLRWDCTPVG